MPSQEILVLLAAIAIMLFGSRSLDKIREAIENFNDHLGGGGGPRPMHPLPVNDAALLRRRFRTKATDGNRI